MIAAKSQAANNCFQPTNAAMSNGNDLVHLALQPIITGKSSKPVLHDEAHQSHQSPTVQLLQLHRQGFRPGGLGSRLGSRAARSPNGSKRHVKLPCFIIASGGISFSISPPKRRRRGKPTSPLTWRPSKAVVLLRKLRRAAHFARLVQASHHLLSGVNEFADNRDHQVATNNGSEQIGNNGGHEVANTGGSHVTSRRRVDLTRPVARQHPDARYLRAPHDWAPGPKPPSPPAPFRAAPRLKHSGRAGKCADSSASTRYKNDWQEVGQSAHEATSPHDRSHCVPKPARPLGMKARSAAGSRVATSPHQRSHCVQKPARPLDVKARSAAAGRIRKLSARPAAATAVHRQQYLHPKRDRILSKEAPDLHSGGPKRSSKPQSKAKDNKSGADSLCIDGTRRQMHPRPVPAHAGVSMHAQPQLTARAGACCQSCFSSALAWSLCLADHPWFVPVEQRFALSCLLQAHAMHCKV